MMSSKCCARSAGLLKSWETRVPTVRIRYATAQSSSSPSAKASGDISSVFPSLSGAASAPLPPRFADVKSQLISGNENSLRASWEDLLSSLREEKEVIRDLGPAIIPELDFKDLGNVEEKTKFRDSLHRRGVAVIRGVVPEEEALGWKELVKRYIKTNPSTRGVSIHVLCYTFSLGPLYRAKTK